MSDPVRLNCMVTLVVQKSLAVGDAGRILQAYSTGVTCDSSSVTYQDAQEMACQLYSDCCPLIAAQQRSQVSPPSLRYSWCVTAGCCLQPANARRLSKVPESARCDCCRQCPATAPKNQAPGHPDTNALCELVHNTKCTKSIRALYCCHTKSAC